MGFMALMNIISILLLGKYALQALQDYQAQKRDGKNPIFHRHKLGIPHTECWEDDSN